MKFTRNERWEQTIRFLMNTVLVAVLAIYFSHVWENYYGRFIYYYHWGNILYVLLYLFLLVVFNAMYGGFSLGTSTTGDLIFSQIISLLFSNFAIFVIVTSATKHVLPASQLFSYIGIDILIIAALDILFNKLYYKVFPPKETIMIYEHEDPSIYQRIMKYQYNSYHISRSISYEDYMKNADQVADYQCVIGADLEPEQKESLVQACYERGRQFYLVPDIYDIIVNSGRSIYLVDTPVFRTNNFGPNQLEKVIKRIWDIIFACVFLVITSPFFLITAIAIKLEDHGPIFYKQTRLTQYGREFRILKFRSMKVDAEKDGKARLAAENDDRITKVGHFIRSCRIDELPQLLNILKGDMSVVGPRPERPEIVQEILKDVPEFNYRLGVKAGLTGYAQVYGKYNTKLKDKLLFDLIYIENFSILLDIRIMFMTFKILFKKDSTEGVENTDDTKEK